MTDVTVVGLGLMGSALARVLLENERSAEGIPLAEYGAALEHEGKGFFTRLALNIELGDHHDTQAKLETWANGIKRIAQHAKNQISTPASPSSH